MGKRRVEQQKVSLIGLFTLAGRHKKMDDVFVYHECQSTRWSHSTKENKQTQSQTLTRAFYCLFVFSCAIPIRFVWLFVLTALSELFSKPRSSLHTVQTL